MSAYSTLYISRAVALEIYYDLLPIPAPSDAELERFLDAALDRSLYNVAIGDDGADPSDETIARVSARVGAQP